MDFNAFVNDIESNQWNVFGAEVYENGRLIHTYKDTDQTKFPIYSATKTIVSIAAVINHVGRRLPFSAGRRKLFEICAFQSCKKCGDKDF